MICQARSAPDLTKVEEEYISGDRGHLPQIRTITVHQKPDGFIEPRPPHLEPSEFLSRDVVHGIKPTEHIPRCRLQAILGKRRGQLIVNTCNSSNSVDVKGRQKIHPVKMNMGSLTRQQLKDYFVLASREHGYWFCVYDNAIPHKQLEERRNHTNEQVAFHANTELSVEELELVGTQILGLEVLEHHRPHITLGVIVDYRLINNGSRMEILMRPFNTKEGRWMCKKIEYGLLNSCSLAHARLDEHIKLYEVSVCLEGARPNTTLCSIVLMYPDEDRIHFPRSYTEPTFYAGSRCSVEPHGSGLYNPLPRTIDVSFLNQRRKLVSVAACIYNGSITHTQANTRLSHDAGSIIDNDHVKRSFLLFTRRLSNLDTRI